MARHHGGSGLGGDRQEIGIGETADVVAQQGAGGVGRLGHRGPPGVHRQRHVEAGSECLDGGHDALELLARGDLAAGSGLDAAHVENVGAVAPEPLGLGQEVVEAPVLAGVEERVGCAVEDSHHQRALGEGRSGARPTPSSTTATLPAACGHVHPDLEPLTAGLHGHHDVTRPPRPNRATGTVAPAIRLPAGAQTTAGP